MKVLKNLLFVGMVILLSAIAFGQTNNISKFGNSSEATNSDFGTKKISILFTMDSLAAMLSEPFQFPTYDGVDLNTYPITYYKKAVSTYGKPQLEIILLAWPEGATNADSTFLYLDTIGTNIDTLESVYKGTLNLNGYRANTYKLLFRNITRGGKVAGDINAGWVELTFPKKEEGTIGLKGIK